MASDFKSVLTELSDSIEALRSFIDSINPVLTQRVLGHIERHAPTILAAIRIVERLSPDSVREDWRQIADKIIEKHSLQNVKVEFDGDVPLKNYKISGLPEGFDLNALQPQDFVNAVQHVNLLARSALALLASTAEYFVGRLLRIAFSENADVRFKDRVISFSDLQAFGSVDDARAWLLEGAIEDVIRGPFTAWIDSLKKDAHLSLGYISADLPALVEVFQRRNLVVHNDGLVNTIYLRRVDSSVAVGLKAGDKIDVDGEYLGQRFNLFQRNFLLIGLEMWKNRYPDDVERSKFILSHVYAHLVAKRWKVAESLSQFLVGDKKMPDGARLQSQINLWQAKKWDNRFDGCVDEIKAFDFSSRSNLFHLARSALIDDSETFFNLLRTVLRNGELSQKEAVEWPLFEAMRKDPRFSVVCGEFEPKAQQVTTTPEKREGAAGDEAAPA